MQKKPNFLTRATLRTRIASYLAVAVALLAVYVVVAVVSLNHQDFSTHGPVSPIDARQQVTVDEAGAVIASGCAAAMRDRVHRLYRGTVKGRELYSCVYLDPRLDDEEQVHSSDISNAALVDSHGSQVTDARTRKAAGMWPWLGTVKRPLDFVWGGILLAIMLGRVLFIVAARRRSRVYRPWRIALGWMGSAITLSVLFGFLVAVLSNGDPWGIRVLVQLWIGVAVYVVASRWWLVADMQPVLAAQRPGVSAASQSSSGAQLASQGSPPSPRQMFDMRKPQDLPNFDDVGGMEPLKQELRDTLGMVLAFADEARSFRIDWNGILLHGPPGTGKTLFARSVAGEFGLTLVTANAADIVSSLAGGSSRNIDDLFAFAATNVPCLLFFDEFDSIAQRRDDRPDLEARRIVNQLLSSLEEYRDVHELIVMAATNDVQSLDPAVTRPGRFDRTVRIDLPDAAARRAILLEQLERRPTDPDLDLDEVVEATEGASAAALTGLVDRAALAVFQSRTADQAPGRIDTSHLLTAITAHAGQDRPMLQPKAWSDIVLPAATSDELRQVQRLIEDPSLSKAYGIEPLTGLLLTGPPGTGKTTIARVLANEARCSFYPVSASDLTSMWVGESERLIRQLFDRARANRPSLIFIDEIDAIASRRGTGYTLDQQVSELLVQIDGMSDVPGVFVLAATNRADRLDPALLRGGRLSRTIEIPVPDLPGRSALLALLTRHMPLDPAVDLPAMTARTEGWSGADLGALCQQAALQAMTLARTPSVVTADDFDHATRELSQQRARTTVSSTE